MADTLAELEARRHKALEMGGAHAVDRQHEAGKLTARERLAILLDAGSFEEIGIHASAPPHPDLANKPTPADAVVTGFGTIAGRTVAVAAYDFTVIAGTIGTVGERKVARMRDLALKHRVPLIWLLDSAGARVQEIASSEFAGTGKLFFDQVMMSGVVPQVAAVMGPCAAGTAYIPALADVVFMVKGTSSMALAGPPLVKAVTGEDTTPEELGGSKVHCDVSGVADREFEDDHSCLQGIRDYLSHFPQAFDGPASLAPAEAPAGSADDLLAIVPTDPRRPYDMHKVLELVVDGGRLFELKPRFGPTLITALARLDGRPVGIVASQPRQLAGILNNDASDKAARFITLCDAFGIPLCFFQDVPGFMVGTKVEREGIIRHGAKMLYAVSMATVPKVTVVVRKAYGAGYYVMCGSGYAPDRIVAWPGAEISLMGPEGAANIVYRKQIEASDDPAGERARRVEQFRDLISPYIAAENGLIDDVIDPRETRDVLIRALREAAGKAVALPARKHGVFPV